MSKENYSGLFYDQQTTAELLGCSGTHLRKQAGNGNGPYFYNFGGTCYRYPKNLLHHRFTRMISGPPAPPVPSTGEDLVECCFHKMMRFIYFDHFRKNPEGAITDLLDFFCSGTFVEVCYDPRFNNFTIVCEERDPVHDILTRMFHDWNNRHRGPGIVFEYPPKKPEDLPLPIPPKTAYTQRGLSEFFCISESQLAKMVKEGTAPKHEPGRPVIFITADVLTWMRANIER